MSPSCFSIVSAVNIASLNSPANKAVLHTDIFPLNFSHFIRRPWQGEGDLSELLKRFDNSSLGIMDPIKMVKRAVSDNLSIKVTEIVPRLKDGGAFVKFSHPAEISPEQVEGTARMSLKLHTNTTGV